MELAIIDVGPRAMAWIKLAMAQKMGRDFGLAILRR